MIASKSTGPSQSYILYRYCYVARCDIVFVFSDRSNTWDSKSVCTDDHMVPFAYSEQIYSCQSGMHGMESSAALWQSCSDQLILSKKIATFVCHAMPYNSQ